MSFPLRDRNRQIVRAETNPLDKSTIVSIYPRDVISVNHTAFPGTFKIPAGSFEKPSLMVIGTSSWFKELEEDQPLLEIIISSIQMANSIIVDYCNGLFGCNMADIMPGLFFVPGKLEAKDVKVVCASQLARANENQKRFWAELVKQADSLWSRTNGNPRSISDDMRLAANELGLTKEWIAGFQNVEMIKCVACGAMRNPNFPICGSCHQIIDVEAYKKLGIQAVK